MSSFSKIHFPRITKADKIPLKQTKARPSPYLFLEQCFCFASADTLVVPPKTSRVSWCLMLLGCTALALTLHLLELSHTVASQFTKTLGSRGLFINCFGCKDSNVPISHDITFTPNAVSVVNLTTNSYPFQL